ncbi:MAG: molybdopterin cofactor-binding domain-containing protein, partial [bacterium]
MTTERDYLYLEDYENSLPYTLNRREFIKITGGGIVIFFVLGDVTVLAQERRFGGQPAAPTDLNAFLKIGEDGRVTCFTGKVELGQGVVVSLAQMLAEELDVPFDSVDMVMGDTDLCPWDRGTHGSMSIRFFGPPLRAAGAEARGVMLELASEFLEVPRERLVVKDGVVSDKNDPQKKVTYAQLAKGQKITKKLKNEAPLK